MTSRVMLKLSIVCGYLAALSVCALYVLMLYGAMCYQSDVILHALLAAFFSLPALLFYQRARSLRRLDGDGKAWAAFFKWELTQQCLILAVCLLLLAMAAHRIFNEGYAVFG